MKIKSARKIKLKFYISLILTLSLMALIFYFSSENIEESRETSSGLVELISDIFFGGSENISVEELDLVTVLVRKTAHMASFGFLCLMCYMSIFYHWRLKNIEEKYKYGKMDFIKKLSAAYIVTVIYAVSDEIHQIFTGRGAMAADVLIDGMGALIAVFIISGAYLFMIASAQYKKILYMFIAIICAAGVYVAVFAIGFPEVVKLFIRL